MLAFDYSDYLLAKALKFWFKAVTGCEYIVLALKCGDSIYFGPAFVVYYFIWHYK